MTDKPLIPDAALDRLWRTARSFDDYTAQPVTDAELRALYDLAKWGPTTANSQPQRVVFVRSAEAKERLAPALSSQNKKKVLGAPVVAILAYDMRFFEHLPKLFHNPAARSWYEPRRRRSHHGAAQRHLAGRLLMLAARAVGLDCGPMSGFKNDVVDAEFFPDGRFKSNFLGCLGYGDPSTLPKQDYRFGFDEVCTIV